MRHHLSSACLFAAAASLSACGQDNEQTAAAPQVKPLHGLAVGKAPGDPQLNRRLAVQGMWKGEPDQALDGHHLVLEVAGTSEYTLDLRGVEAGQEAVFASARGRLSWTRDDLLHGKGDGKGALAGYREWSAGFTGPDRMTLRTGARDVELTRVKD